MSNKRETNLWKQINWLSFILAIAAIPILGGIYFTIWQLKESVWREFFLNLVANLIAAPVIYVIVYMVMRRIEELRSERDAEELANKVVAKFFQILEEIQAKSPTANNAPLSFVEEGGRIPPDMKLRLELDVTAKKPFDSKSNPQKILVNCAYHGSNDIYIKKIVFQGTNLKVKDHLSDIYKRDGFNAIISEEQVKVSSGVPYTFELVLANTKRWKKDEMESWYEKLGFLHFNIEYENQPVNIAKPI